MTQTNITGHHPATRGRHDTQLGRNAQSSPGVATTSTVEPIESVQDALSLRSLLGNGQSFREQVTPLFESIHGVGDVPQKHLDWLFATARAVDILEGRPLRHGARVAMLSGLMAQALKLTPREITAAVLGGLLHDIGLYRVAGDLVGTLPKELPEKTLFHLHRLLQHQLMPLPQGITLSAASKQSLQAHAQHGQQLVSQLLVSQDVATIVGAHHECWDGTGYPLGLSQQAIPMGARITALADTIEALMTEVTGVMSRLETAQKFIESQLSLATEQTPLFDTQVLESLLPFLDDQNLIRTLYSTEVEGHVEQMLVCHGGDRRCPMHAVQVLDMAIAFGSLSDGLMPQFTSGPNGGHSHNVALLAIEMAKSLGIAPKQQADLAVAALIHDIGMANVPLEVLLKVSPLTKPEWEVIHAHPQFTEACFKGTPGLDTVVTWAADHHERINGSGYPCRRKANDILVGGRILALADTYCALTAFRPYRASAYGPIDALALVQQSRSRLYDNKLVNVLTHVLRRSQPHWRWDTILTPDEAPPMATKAKPLLYNQIHLPVTSPVDRPALNLSTLSMT